MKKSFLISVMLASTAFANSIANAADAIPKPFHGRWGTPDTCAETGELPTEINATSYNPYEMGCDLKKVIKSSDTLFIGRFLCSFEGEEEIQKHTLELKNGKLFADGIGPTPKCK